MKNINESVGQIGWIRHGMIILALVCCTVLTLLPLLTSGYYSDDLIHATLKAQIELRNVSFFEYLFNMNRQWVTENGRYYPVFFLMVYPVAYLSHDLIVYKSIVLLMVIINVLVFGRLVKMVTGDVYASYLAMLIMPLMFQFRLYHDPILSFCGMMQSFMVFTLVAAVMFRKYLDVNHRGYLVASLVLYNFTLYFYEISFPLVLLFLILATESGRRGGIHSALRKVLPYFVSTACALAIMVLVRTLRNPAAAGYAGNTIHLGAGSVARTLLAQLTATLPLSYSLFDPANLFQGTGVGEVSLPVLLPVIGFAPVYWHLTSKVAGVPTKKLLLLGGTLTFLPALMISLSLKYQKELQPGLGYLPVYVQYFGLALLVVWLLQLQAKLVATKWRYCLRLATCAALSFCLLRTVQNNRTVVDKANIDMHFRRAALVKALKEGILASVPESANLLILDEYAYDPQPTVRSDLRGWAESGYPWKNSALVYQYAGKRLSVMTDMNELAKLVSVGTTGAGADTGAYLLKVQSFPGPMHKKEGFVILSKIDGLTVDVAGKVKFRTIPLKTNFPERS
jgi:hypothetical protein